MKALVNNIYGGPEVLRVADIPIPKPKENELLIKVHATTVNRTDCGFLKGKPHIVRLFSGLTKPKNPVLGNEFCGVVEEIGSKVTLFKPGDEVTGLEQITFGAHAEYMVVAETASVYYKPKNFTFEEAVAMNEGPWLAMAYLKRLNIKPGQSMLLHGASGSIGSSAVQLAKYLGLEITAVCGTKNVELVKSLGADEVIDYQTQDFTAINKTFDYVFDAVGKSSYFTCKHLMKEQGIFFATDFGKNLENVWLTILKSKSSGKRVTFPLPKENKEDIKLFTRLAEEGKLKPVIDRYYTMEEIPDAYRYALTEQKTGSLVVRVV